MKVSVCFAYCSDSLSGCGIFVYRLVTSIDTMKVRFPIFVSSMKLMKSVAVFKIRRL